MFDNLRQGAKSIEYLMNPDAGEVKVGCNPVLAASFVPAVIDRITRRFPRVGFRVLTGINETLREQLNERNVDLLISRRFMPINSERFSFEKLYDDSYVVAAGANHPLVGRRKLTLAALAKESWALAPPEAVIGAAALEAFRKFGLEFPPAAVLSVSPEVRFALLATGRFLTILPTSFSLFSPRKDIKALSAPLPLGRETIGVVSLKDRTMPPLVKLFIECAKDVAMQAG